MSKVLAALAILAFPALAPAQDQDSAELKKRILERVRQKLSSERAAFLKKVERIIDEEYAKGPSTKPAPSGDPKLKDLEKKLRLLDDQREALAAEIAKAKRLAEDEPVRKEAAKDGPHDGPEAQSMFKEALKLHEAKDFTKSIRLFKRIYYQFPETEIAFICAYNVACGHALAGQKDAALDWLEISVEAGYNDFDHMRKDTDLDTLRGEKRYKKLLTDR